VLLSIYFHLFQCDQEVVIDSQSNFAASSHSLLHSYSVSKHVCIYFCLIHRQILRRVNVLATFSCWQNTSGIIPLTFSLMMHIH